MGNMIEAADDWWRPTAPVPDGTYALFRSDEAQVELVTDMLASRTIWYVHTDTMFLAATSQRALVYFLRDFQPNEETRSWLLFSGTLGYGLSWDRRIRWLPGNSRLVLNRSSWTTKTTRDSVPFRPVASSRKAHQQQLKEATHSVFDHLAIDPSKWVLPLSGGYDSGAVLLFLKHGGRLKCVTWGSLSALQNKHSDACVAQQLAAALKVPWEYLETDVSDEPIEVLLRRFLVAGEGRFDNIAGYMDGFKIWKRLFESEAYGIIRGDEGFGLARVVSTPLDVRRHSQVVFASDFPNIGSAAAFDCEEQRFPEALRQQEGETLMTWRERLYQEFRVATGNSALTDLKCAYVELVNPFLSRRIITQIRTIPDRWRTEKQLWKEIVRSMRPKVGFAKYSAVTEYEDVLKGKRMVEVIADELDAAHARAVLPNKLINFIRSKIKVSGAEPGRRGISLRARIKYYMPMQLKNVLRHTVLKRQMDYNVLGLRAYMIVKMNELLAGDARAISEHEDQ